MKTQVQIVEAELLKKGWVSNFWALQHYILRLGSRMNDLKNNGVEFSSGFGKQIGAPRSQWKNYFYWIDEKKLQRAIKRMK